MGSPPRVTPYSKHLELNEEGTAVAVDRRFVPYLFYPAWCLLTLQTMTDLILSRLGHLQSPRFGFRTISQCPCMCYGYCRSKREAEDDDDDDDDEDEGDEDDENEEEGSEEEESEEEAPVPAATNQLQEELSRAERKALKKQGKKKEVAEDEVEDEDPLLANPNRTVGRMKISDLNAPREPTRKER